ncbi:hypothetical protein BC629DRAFT_1597899 [Irpex lacteus]|nr:hypothetical protein BC629DRAFT_1597899 [Irpex lacteus]
MLQGYIYFPSNDRRLLQIIAVSMLVLNATSAALVAQSVFYYLVPHFGSLVPLNAITDELSAECLISTVITFISQVTSLYNCGLVSLGLLYTMYLIYAVADSIDPTVAKVRNGSFIIPILVGTLSVAAAAEVLVGCTTVMVVHKHSVLAARSEAFSVFFGLAKGFGALTDIIATIAMCSMLASARTGFDSTNSVIRALMHFIMQRGILVTLIQTLLLITFHAAPNHLYWLAFHVNVTKLYANTFCNRHAKRRERINQQRTATGKVSSYPSNISFGTSRDNKSKVTMSSPGPTHTTTTSSFAAPSTKERNSNNRPDMPLVTKTVLVSDL